MTDEEREAALKEGTLVHEYAGKVLAAIDPLPDKLRRRTLAAVALMLGLRHDEREESV